MTDDKDIAEDVETKFDTSELDRLNYELDRLFPKGKNEKVIGLIKDELGQINMINFFGLRAKTSSYSVDDNSEEKKEKDKQMCLVEGKLEFESFKNCLEAIQLENKINDLKKINLHR